MFIRMTGAFILALLVLVCLFSKSQLFLAANSFHTSWMDSLFLLATGLGDGLFAAVLALAFLLAKKRVLVAKLAATFLLSGLVAQLLKNLIRAPRPRSFFPQGYYTHFIDGITHSGLNSFPSGHATTAFALAAMLAFNISCRKWCLLFFLLAITVAYSRVYLGQHFIEDVLAGTIVGVCSSLGIEYFYQKYFMNRLPARRIAMAGPEPLSIEL